MQAPPVRGGTNKFSFRYEYDTALSAQIGAQMNRKEYDCSDFGPWERAKGAVFFTSAFWNSGTAVDGPQSRHRAHYTPCGTSSHV